MKKKAWLSAVLCMALCIPFAGCSGNGGTQKTTPQGTLRVYRSAKEGDAMKAALERFAKQYPDVQLQIESFTDAEEMDARLGTELEQGNLPDVVLMDNQSVLDMEKWMAKGAFLDLAPQFQEDSTFQEGNYYPVLSAGKLGEKQLAMPLSFSLLYATANEQMLAETGITVPGKGLTDEQLLEFLQKAQALEPENGEYLGLGEQLFQGMENFPSSLMLALGTPLTYGSAVTITPEVSTAAALVRENTRHKSDVVNFSYRFENNLVGQVQYTVLSLSERYLPASLRILDAVSAKEGLTPRLVVVPGSGGEEKYHGTVTQYALVGAKSQNPGAAFSLVRFLMDEPMDITVEQLGQPSMKMGFPINKQAAKTLLSGQAMTAKAQLRGQGGLIDVPPLSDTRRDEILSILDKVASANLRNPQTERIVRQWAQAEQPQESALHEELTKYLAS